MRKLIITTAILVTAMFASSVLATTTPILNPPTEATGSPVLSVSFHVKNDEDSGVKGYWALDDYIKTIIVWKDKSVTNGYDAYIGYSGTFCTFAGGALSPFAGTAEPNDGCGTMEGGRDATFTSVSGPANTSSPGTKDFGGTKADIQRGTYGNGQTGGTPWDWKGYYFSSMAGYTDTAWSWTYTLPIGATTQWINDIAVNTGDIITNAGSVNTLTVTVSECTENSQCDVNKPICVSGVCSASACGVSASGIAFGALVPGQTKGDDLSITSTLTNGGNTPTTSLGISGTDWVGTLYNSGNTMLVGDTSWSVGSGWNPLTTSNVVTGANVAPGSPLTAYFKLAVPLGQPADNYQQTITLNVVC